MMAEVRSDLIPRVTLEHRRYTEHMQDEPDVLVLHPEDRKVLSREVSDAMPWAVKLLDHRGVREATFETPPVAEIDYGQFLSMDIVVTDRMPQGFFVVGKREPIKNVALQRARR